MIAALKSNCILVLQESDVIGCYNNTFSLYQINAEAHTGQTRPAIHSVDPRSVVFVKANFNFQLYSSLAAKDSG